MINFSGITNNSVVGKLLRLPLKLIPEGAILPIVQGKLKGKKWIVGSSNHGCWLGTYEFAKQRLFSETIREGSVVYDIGAHVGFYTLLASVLVGPKGKVVAFEPLPRNIYYLKEHLRLNQCKNVTLVEAAVCEQNGMSCFKESGDSYTGHLFSKDGIAVKTVCIDDLLSKGEIPSPDLLKIDVEGAELSVLSGAKLMTANYHPTIFLSTHASDLHQQCCKYLKSMGYKLRAISEKDTIDNTSEIVAFRQHSKLMFGS